ncbi:unnamed protein product [Polarella glacialis]|uniref:Methyltransferase type 11 domain-containing protein n=1 Tax=Polarella glacialis TaxID=89957 RepID=A0A813LIZ4_POLGL|nr:unnamed protein product [Polarella glacialis]
MHAIHAALRLRGEGRLTVQEAEVYSRAAPIVGSKAWSKETVRWVLSELQAVALCRGPGEAELHLLDVGSSFGAFFGHPGLRCVALDLAPAHPEVWQADFFQLPILPLPLQEGCRVLRSDDGSMLLALEAGSFDAVVLSLVLSFLPTPRLRRDMLDRVRKCLRTGGSLLLVEKAALAAHGAAGLERRRAFQEAVEAAGFVSQCCTSLGRLDGGRRPHAHAWHLIAGSEPRLEPGPAFREDLACHEEENGCFANNPSDSVLSN